MKVLLDIKEEKVAFIMELLSNFKFVKAKPLSPEKAEQIEGLKEAVNQVKAGKEGKADLKSAHDLLNEL